jgi:hypothetical protein
VDTEQQTGNPYDTLFEAGKRLLEAMEEERTISQHYPEDISKIFSYIENVSAARKRVDVCAAEYCTILDETGCTKVAEQWRSGPRLASLAAAL